MISIAPIGKAEGKLACRECFFFPTSFTLVHSCARLALRVRRPSLSPFVRAEGRKKGIDMNNYNQHFSFRIPFYNYNDFLSYRN